VRLTVASQAEMVARSWIVAKHAAATRRNAPLERRPVDLGSVHLGDMAAVTAEVTLLPESADLWIRVHASTSARTPHSGAVDVLWRADVPDPVDAAVSLELSRELQLPRVW
jgi:hypothetical protein